MQPYFALLDVLSELYVEETGQDDPSKGGTEDPYWTSELRSRPRFARRNSCLLLVYDRCYDRALDRWHDKFSRCLRDTLYVTQALKRATADRTTVQRASFDKAFDLTTAVSPQAFPYTVMPARISDDLASMLHSRPCCPWGSGCSPGPPLDPPQPHSLDPLARTSRSTTPLKAKANLRFNLSLFVHPVPVLWDIVLIAPTVRTTQPPRPPASCQ